MKNKEWYDRKKVNGICRICSSPVVSGLTLCQKHLEIDRERLRKRRLERVSMGLCSCGRPSLPDMKNKCAICREKSNARSLKSAMVKYNKRKDTGLCVQCGRYPSSNGIYCSECRIERRTRAIDYKIRLKEDIIHHYGGECAICGTTVFEHLTIDHTNGGGNEHRKKIGKSGGHDFYKWLIENGYPDGYRVLCWNCNCS